MKHRLLLSPKWFFSVLLVAIALLAVLSRAGTSLADPPAPPPEGEQPIFSASSYTAADGSAAVHTQEAVLDSDYFKANGYLVDLESSPAGLTLAQGQVSGVYESGVIHSPLAFTTDIAPLWQVDLPAGTGITLETRLGQEGDSWSEWTENPAAFYPVRHDEHSGRLIWVGHNRAALQFRLTLYSDQAGNSPTLRTISLIFNDTSSGPTDEIVAARIANLAAPAGICPAPRPAIVSRTDWGNPDGQNSPRRPPAYQAVSHVIIHQAETPNALPPYQNWAGWVRSIWNYHANVLGWGDVGYNYLIDPNGVVYEGRAGGDDVIGIHDRHNRGSLSIGFLGCYGNCDDPCLGVAEPDPVMLDKAEALMAWKLGQKGIDPLSSAPYARLSSVPVIAGGRDVVDTSSPGDNLYAALPTMRQNVAERVNCTPPPPASEQACQIKDIIFDQDQYRIGDIINVTIRLADFQGTPLGGAKVTAEVQKEIIFNQALTGFDLIDRSGEYEGVYHNTNVAGAYSFMIMASDLTGEHFAPCTAVSTVLVTGDTPPPTPNIPTPTPTPPIPPGATSVKVSPPNLVIPTCNAQATTAINVENVSNMFAVQLELSYDPAIVQIIDADPNREGVQVKVGSAFSGGFAASNIVDTDNGHVSVVATLFGSDKIDGNTELIAIDWLPRSAGVGAVTLEDVILVNASGQVIEFSPHNGAVEVIPNCAGIAGIAMLQGRVDHSGIIITNSTGEQTYTEPDGAFSIAGGDVLNLKFPGYLSAQADIRVGLELAQANVGSDSQSAGLGAITLLAGDVNGDEVIDILDLAYLATHYQTDDSLADLNADGIVNILDLAMVAGNYRQQGPLTAWQ